jgi:hypothetical protein
MEITLTPFQMRPDLRVTVTNAQGQTVAQMDIVHVMTPQVTLTLHLRETHPGGEYTAILGAFSSLTRSIFFDSISA